MDCNIRSEWLDSLYETLCYYTPIPNEEWQQAKSLLKTRKLGKEEFFIRAGERPGDLGFIVAGLFKVFYVTEDGIEKTLVFREENNFISAYSSFLQETETLYSIQAIEDSTLLYLPLTGFEKLKKGHNCWHVMAAKYTERLFLEKETRENELLTLDATRRYLRFVERNPGLSKRIPKFQIASYLGISPVSLSRIRSR